MENNRYLGTEKIGRLLTKFCIPCIASLIISCLYNIVDQVFVGNKLGYLGNAATGVIFPITVVGWGMPLFFGDGAAGRRISIKPPAAASFSRSSRVESSILVSYL